MFLLWQVVKYARVSTPPPVLYVPSWQELWAKEAMFRMGWPGRHATLHSRPAPPAARHPAMHSHLGLE